MRVVVDSNVLVSSLISGAGRSRQIVDAWVQGRFELVASPVLLGELSDVVSRPRFRRWVSLSVAGDFVAGLEDAALVLDGPSSQSGRAGLGRDD